MIAPGAAAATTLGPDVAATNELGLSLNWLSTGIAGPTVAAAVELLFAPLPSAAVVVTVAVLLSGPEAVGRTTIPTAVDWPGPREPRVQVTFVVPAQVP